MENLSVDMVARWLKGLDLPGYLQPFLDNGYDDLAVCQEIGPADLDAIGVLVDDDRKVILDGVQKLRSHRDLNLGMFGHPVFDTVGDMTSMLLERYSHLTEKSLRGNDESCMFDGWSEVEKQWHLEVAKSRYNDVNKYGDHGHDDDDEIKTDDDDYKMFSVYGQSTRSSTPPAQHLSFENKFDDDILDRKPSIRSLNRNNCATTEPPIESLPQSEDEERKEQGLKEQFVGTLNKIFRSLSFRRSPKKYSYEQYTGDLKASEMMMGESERMDLMFKVKSGKLSVLEAVHRPNNIELQIIGKSRSMDEKNLARHHHHHHHHSDQATPSPFASRRFDHLRLPDRNRNLEFSENPGKSSKLSPPPLPPLPSTAIMESLSAERLHPARHHYHYRNEDDEDEDDDNSDGGLARMSANPHQPDVVADHATYHNYRRFHHHHHHHHRHRYHQPFPLLPPPPLHHHHHHHHPHRRLHHHEGDITSFHDYRCQFCSVVRKSRSLHLAAPKKTDLGGANMPHLGRWADWNSTEELKTLKFLKQCTAERLKLSPVSRFTTRQKTDLTPRPFDLSSFNQLQVNPAVTAAVAAPDCVPAYQQLSYNPQFHALYQEQYHNHHHRQQSLPSSSSSSCDGWGDLKSDTRSLPVQRSGTMADLFKRIGLQHLTEKFKVSGRSTLNELADLNEDDLFKVGVEDELDRVKLLTVAQFMQDCRQYFGSLHTVRSQSPAAAISRDASIQTANET